MKKLTLAVLAVFVSVPVFAQETQPAAPEHKKPAMQRGQGHEAFAKAHQEQMAKMKATEEKMGKLVQEYNKLKDGKKKDAKRAEIEKEVAAIRDEQMKFKQDQLGKFEERLGGMKEELAKENTTEGKQEWVNQKTDELIKNGGSVRALFEPRDGQQGPRMGGQKGKGPHFGKGSHFGKGPRPGKGPRFGGHDKQLPPPPDAELPVQRPVEK